MKLEKLDIAVIVCVSLGLTLGVVGLITGEKISTLSTLIQNLAFGILYLSYVKVARKDDK